jgi:acyl-CoA-binding protein
MRSAAGIGFSWGDVAGRRAAGLGNMRGARIVVSPIGATAMSKLETAFRKAVDDSKKLPEKPDNATLLQIYSLYKQATEGDVQGKRPGFTDMVGRAKYDAWAKLEGKSAEDAMQEYVDLIESLK